MSFQKFYGLGDQIGTSALATVPERLYRTPDTEQAAPALLQNALSKVRLIDTFGTIF